MNYLLSFRCLVNSFHFVNQSNGWTFNNSVLDFLLLHSDGLHLVEKDNLELKKPILKEVDSTITCQELQNSTKMQRPP